MTAKIAFTPATLKGLACPAGKSQAIFWDEKQPGLGYRITQNNARAFIFEGRFAGKTLRVTLNPRTGSDITVTDARNEAKRLAAMIAAGTDPRQVVADNVAAAEARRVAEEAERQRQQLTGLVAWVEYCTARNGQWGDHHRRDMAALVRPKDPQRKGSKAGPLHDLLSDPLATLDAPTVVGWLEGEVEHRPGSARRSFKCLAGFVTWASKQGKADAQAVTADEVRELVPDIRARSDVLTKQHLPAWWRAVHRCDSVAVAYLVGILLTGARPGEWRALEWTNISFGQGSITIRDKVKGQRTIPMTPYVRELLKAVPRTGPLVFGKNPRHWMEVHREALREAKLTPAPDSEDTWLTLHGLRRSFSTLSEWVELPVGIAAQMMGHSGSAIAEKHYKVRPLDLLAFNVEKYERWVLSEVNHVGQ